MKKYINKIIISLYIIVLTLSLIEQIACYYYYKSGYAAKIRALFPDEIVYPVYDIVSNEVVNAEDVTVWEETDFVSNSQFTIHKYFRGVADAGGFANSIILTYCFLPILICYKRIEKKPYLAFSLLVLNFFMAGFVLPRISGAG